MKNIGILTFQNANNYGAVFQAFALQTTLEKLGVNAKVVNYDSQPMMLKRMQKKVFAQFIEENLHLTSFANEKEKIDTKGLDAILCGSDQVWNPHLTQKDTTYFLDFVDQDIQKVSYAASIGLTEENCKEYQDIFKKYLPDFDKISLREESNVPYIQNLLQGKKKVQANVDPSLLLTKEEYLKAFHLPLDSSEEYIFVFSYAYDPKLYDFANMLSLQTGYKIVALTFYNDGSFVDNAKVLMNVKPEDWLMLFNRAKIVLTDSFHGMMFSMVFQKPFYVYTPNRYNVARIKDALEKFGLKDRTLKTVRNIKDVSFSLDYQNVNQVICAEKEKSMEYLKSI